MGLMDYRQMGAKRARLRTHSIPGLSWDMMWKAESLVVLLVLVVQIRLWVLCRTRSSQPGLGGCGGGMASVVSVEGGQRWVQGAWC